MIRSIDFLWATINAYDGKKGHAAKAIGVNPAVLSTWLKRDHISPPAAKECAKLVGEDPEFAEAIAGAEQIQDEHARTNVLKTIHRAFNKSFKLARRAMTLNRR